MGRCGGPQGSVLGTKLFVLNLNCINLPCSWMILFFILAIISSAHIKLRFFFIFMFFLSKQTKELDEQQVDT